MFDFETLFNITIMFAKDFRVFVWSMLYEMPEKQETARYHTVQFKLMGLYQLVAFILDSVKNVLLKERSA